MKHNLITLEKYNQGDFSTYYSLVKEDNVMRYISGEGLTVAAAREKFDSIIEINTDEIHIGYFMIYNGSGDFLGDGKLEWHKHDPTKLEIGYILKEEFWGRGYGTLVCAELLALAEKVLSTKDIIGVIDPENEASKKLLEKFGFQSYFIGIEDDLPTEKLILRK